MDQNDLESLWTISAENIPDAGARFILIFPPIERAPDLENTEVKAAEYVRKLEATNRADSGQTDTFTES